VHKKAQKHTVLVLRAYLQTGEQAKVGNYMILRTMLSLLISLSPLILLIREAS
jgi:hypothetical protein